MLKKTIIVLFILINTSCSNLITQTDSLILLRENYALNTEEFLELEFEGVDFNKIKIFSQNPSIVEVVSQKAGLIRGIREGKTRLEIKYNNSIKYVNVSVYSTQISLIIPSDSFL